METILLVVTAGSLVLAFIMSAAAWRISREQRARASARVAALAAAAAEAPVPAPATAEARPTAVVTHRPIDFEPVDASRDLVMEPMAAQSGAARIASFTPVRASIAPPEFGQSALAHAKRVPDLTLNNDVAEETLLGDSGSAAITESFLGLVESPNASAGRQRVLMVAAAILFVVVAGSAYVALSGTKSSTSATNVAPSPAASTAPLELISLRNERHGARLSLSGLVRNPSGAAAIDNLSAVAFLFDAQGGFISSARTGVDFKRLAPGDESPFVINVDAPANVARYRVSFRTDAGIVAHVDRRNDQPIAAADVRGKD